MVIDTSDPEGANILATTPIWDAHVHLGIDRDGTTQSLAEIMHTLETFRIRKACVFPFDAINSAESFKIPNGHVFSAFKKHPQTIIPFMRLSPHDEWRKEAELRRKQGFKGIKLHPRAQQFSLTDPKAMEIYAFAEEHGLAIIIHTGLGTENIAIEAERIMKSYPKLKLILAHAGLVDLTRVVSLIVRKPQYEFYLETSTVKVYDLYDILRIVPPERVIFGSDVPYADMEVGLAALVDVALMLGHNKTNIAQMLGGNLARCLGMNQ